MHVYHPQCQGHIVQRLLIKERLDEYPTLEGIFPCYCAYEGRHGGACKFI